MLFRLQNKPHGYYIFSLIAGYPEMRGQFIRPVGVKKIGQ